MLLKHINSVISKIKWLEFSLKQAKTNVKTFSVFDLVHLMHGMFFSFVCIYLLRLGFQTY